MGKETKVGLAVIGVLLSVFGVLLFRHFLASHAPPAGSEQAQAPIEPLSSAGMSKPSVVVASKDAAGISSKMWDEPQPTVVEPSGQAPAASYMPSDPYAAASQPDETADQSGDAGMQGEGEPDSATTRSTGTSSFQGSTSEPGQVSENQALELPQAEPESRNPLRKLSAEMPLDATQEPVAGAAESPDMELPAADPYVAPAPNARPDPLDIPNSEPETAPHSDPFADSDRTAAAPVEGNDAEWGAAEHAVMPGEGRSNEHPAAAPAQVTSDPFDRFEAEPSRPETTDDRQVSPSDANPAAADPRTATPATVTSAAEQPLPVENGMYTVQPGDTLWSISEKVYGTGGYFKALAARNRSMLPRSDKLTVGTQVAVPPTTDLERDYPALCPRQRKSALVRPQAIPPAAAQRRANNDVYIVAEGDTLFDIARYELGKASRWAEIYELNRDLLGEDFDYLRPGTELVMPPQAETATRPAASRY